MAVFGGLSLIAPMLIMTLHPSVLTVLVTTSVSVLIVGALLAIGMAEAEPKDFVAATAAYAAVLVVFVGNGGGGTANAPQASRSTISNGKIGGIVAGCIAGTLLLMLGIFLWWRMVIVRSRMNLKEEDM